MRISRAFIVGLGVAAADAKKSTSIAFTYLSLSQGSVGTTSTSYPTKYTPPPAAVGQASSFQLNSSALAYPTFPVVPLAEAEASPGNGLPNVTQLLLEAAELVIVLSKTANATNCATCKQVLSTVAARVKVQQETLSVISGPFCAALGGTGLIPTPICIGLLNVASTDFGGLLPALDLAGEDGQLLCAYMFGLCTLPAVPPLDLNRLFKGTAKPAHKALKPSGRKPLKVLHFSDYHLDLRYVVGSEANCAGQLCCRVFPYSNTSTPVKTPASLFGNYQCDTPQALGTSVFRAVPSVTGHDWDDFAFGLYTGDLVSHDIWELTKPYVEQEEMEAYQEFFNGMGGVPLYPTLGNHDTLPQAFTAFPNQNDKLLYNASYPVQQLWNYELAARAWANYEWLSHEDAQQVINTGLGIYRTVTKEGLVIISLNSDVWYYFNLYAYIQGNNGDHTGMFSILIDYLLEAEACDQPVWLIQHVNVGGGTGYEALPAPSDLWYAIVDRFNHTIRGTFFGHTHADEFGVIYSNNATVQSADTAAAVAWIMPSVTPYQNFNAGFRYYLVDPITFQVMDAITYYANISDTDAWQKTGDVDWQLEYSARQTYNYDGRWPVDQPLTPAFWHSVAADIATNETTFRTYTDLRTKKVRPYAPPSDRNKNLTICGLMSMSVPIFERCLGSMESTTAFL